MERHLTERQKKLKRLRKRRIDQATEQAKVDEQMAQYKELMAAELERLNQEIIEEEGAYAEEVEHYKASVEVLQIFKKADNDVWRKCDVGVKSGLHEYGVSILRFGAFTGYLKVWTKFGFSS